MEAIGLSFNDLVSRQAEEWERASSTLTKEQTQSSIAQHINRGCSVDEADFRATITAQISSIVTAILATIDANNKRILIDLKRAGLLNQ